MLSLEVGAQYVFLRIDPDVAVCRRGLTPELERLAIPDAEIVPQKV
jgi:hypothetical protein